VISVPVFELMRAQRWLATHVLNHLPVHHSSFAFKPGSSIVKCASRHCGARWLVKMDIAGFFPSISEIQIYRVFRSLGYQPLVAFELARLTSHSPQLSPRYTQAIWLGQLRHKRILVYSKTHLGYLPQGAPTSPMLSNLIMREADAEIENTAKIFGLVYTRYSDDLIFSTRDGHFGRSKAAKLLARITRILGQIGLYIQKRKTKIVPPGARKIVLGLVVNSARPTLTREYRSLLRQHLYYLKSVGPVEHAKRRGFETVWGMHSYIRGLIDFARMVDGPYADEMLVQFLAVDWPL
jgi:RNA-directed DNA polymerase